MALVSTAALTVKQVSVYPMKSIWASMEAVRDAKRVYHSGPPSLTIDDIQR
jgi:hypothetical protein